MPRRYQEPEHVNRERWVVSYADFITLLFAFFVVMYSVSSVNEGKYKILSESLEDVFKTSSKILVPIPLGDKNSKVIKSMDSFIVMPVPGDYASDLEYEFGIEGLKEDVAQGNGTGKEVLDGEGYGKGTGSPKLSEEEEIKQLKRLKSDLKKTFSKLIGDGTLSVKGNNDFIEIEIKNSILFKSGSADANKDARFLIRKIGNMLEQTNNPVQVEGFTDNVPIKNDKFPSNWELSSARAATIVRMIAVSGVDPKRLAAVGFGEFQPIADNTTVEGRKQNRRVALIISRGEGIRRNTEFDLSDDVDGNNNGVFDPFAEIGESIQKAVTGGKSETRDKPRNKVPSFRLKSGELLFTKDPKGRRDLLDVRGSSNNKSEVGNVSGVSNNNSETSGVDQ